MRLNIEKYLNMDSNSAESDRTGDENGDNASSNEASIEERLAKMAVENEDDDDDKNGRTGEKKELPKLTRQSTGDFDYSELPRSLIATNVDDDVFMDESIKVR